MKHLIPAALLAASLTTAMAQPAPALIGKHHIQSATHLMTPEDLWAMGRIGAAAASPDGQMIAYQVGYYSVEQNKSRQVIRVVATNVADKKRKALTATPIARAAQTEQAQSETDPAWIGGGATIAFLCGGEIWQMRPDGTERRQLSHSGGVIEGFQFAPDGTKVLIIKSLPSTNSIRQRPADLPKSTGRVITDLMYRHWDHYVETMLHPFVCAVNADGTIATAARDLLEGEPYECPMEPFGGMEQLAWSPDSKTIAYTCRKKTGREYSISTDSDIYLYDLATATTRNLCKQPGYKAPAFDATRSLKDQPVNAPDNVRDNNPGYDQNPQFSPDGTRLAWQSMARDGYESDRNRLCVYELATGTKTYVTESFDSNVDAFCWMPGGEQLAFVGVWHGCTNVYQTDLGGHVRQLTDEWADYTSVAPLGTSGALLAARQSQQTPTDLYAITPNAKPTKKNPAPAVSDRLTAENEHIMSQLHTGRVQQRWVSTKDGQKMLVWVVLPADFDETKQYPALLFCEGGPQSPVSQFWSYRWNFQIMAAHGYVVIAPNRRGLPGFGTAWNEAVSTDWTGACMDDYLAATDDAARNLPFVDKDRMAAVGASFGGFSVYYLAGIHEGRFKCFISHDGAFNLESMYTDTEENWFSNWEYDNAYWDKNATPAAKRTYANSPHRMVDRWDTPILCIHGELDYRINATQGMGAFNAARMRGIPARLLLFPDENHWVLKPQNGILWQRTFFEWLHEWI